MGDNNKSYFGFTIIIFIGFLLVCSVKFTSADIFSSTTKTTFLHFIRDSQLNLDEKLIQIFKNFWLSIGNFFEKFVKLGQDIIYKSKEGTNYELNAPINFVSFLSDLFKKIHLIISALFGPIITLSASFIQNIVLFLVKIFKILVEIALSFIENL